MPGGPAGEVSASPVLQPNAAFFCRFLRSPTRPSSQPARLQLPRRQAGTAKKRIPKLFRVLEGAALMRQMHGEITDPGFAWLWTLAKLQLPEAPQHSFSVLHGSNLSQDVLQGQSPQRPQFCQAELRACAAVAAIRALEAPLLDSVSPSMSRASRGSPGPTSENPMLRELSLRRSSRCLRLRSAEPGRVQKRLKSIIPKRKLRVSWSLATLGASDT